MSDSPTVRIERQAESPLEAGRGSLSLTCITSSNPPGRTMWWRQGQAAAPQYRDQLVFDPVTRDQAGDYVCAAENSVGRSEEAVTSVEVLCKSEISEPAMVKYLIFPDGPERLQTTPVSEDRAVLHNTTSLYCSAEAVPPPSYQWLQEVPGTGEVRRRANTPTLEIMDVWYDDQGTYRCVATNTIGGQTREIQSDLIRLDVSGPPQISTEVSKAEGVLGEEAELRVEFCSDPGPIRNTWQWEEAQYGEVILPSGNNYHSQSLSLSHRISLTSRYSLQMGNTQPR